MKKGGHWKWFFSGVVILAVAVGLSGCGQSAGADEGGWGDKAAGSFITVATRGRINLDAGTGNIDFWDSTQEKAIRVLKKMPEGFPRDFPVYPGAKLASGIIEDDSSVMMISFEVNDSLERVKDYYERKLVLNEWEWEYMKEGAKELSIFVYKRPFSGTVWLKGIGNQVQVDVNLEN